MNILYISHLIDTISAGPNYSVPAQIKAQAKYDNVFWWNLTDAVQEFWVDTGLFHGIKDFPVKNIHCLPKPFHHPDLVIFESFYYIDDVKIAAQCRKLQIPYIIVPRSAFTWQGQKKKRIKKAVANLFLFRRMACKAVAIQYLTKKEQADSGRAWNTKSFVMPNGIAPVEISRECRGKSKIRGVYIGRFDFYQKGLDLLLEACKNLKEKLIEHDITITLYGPERLGCRKEFIASVKENKLEKILCVSGGVFGDEKRNILNNADFFIMTSRFEGMPMSLIEAMSYHLPCLVTDGTNMADEISEYYAGWTSTTDTKGIQSAMEHLIKDLGQLHELGENAYSLSQNYNWDKIANKTHTIYRSLLS